eukprot:259727-Chlamydomonas_euryale.AAC.7
MLSVPATDPPKDLTGMLSVPANPPPKDLTRMLSAPATDPPSHLMRMLSELATNPPTHLTMMLSAPNGVTRMAGANAYAAKLAASPTTMAMRPAHQVGSRRYE